MRLLEIFSIIDEERALLFELRNVVNNQDVKKWSEMTARDILARPFVGTDAFDQVYAWGKKALLKWMLENAPGEPVRMDPAQRIADVGGNNFKRLEELPEWMQQALLRGDELTWIDISAMARGRAPSEIMQVADWLRYKYQTEPRTFTRLNRIPWHEALRMTQEYHAELERKRPRSVNEMLDWFRQNPDATEELKGIISQKDGYLATVFSNTVDSREESDYQSFIRTFGSKIFNQIQKYFKQATGFTIELPKDDPTGRQEYLRYDKEGKPTTAFKQNMEREKEKRGLEMDWGDPDWGWEVDKPQDQDAQTGAEEVEAEDFDPAPEFGPGWYKLTTSKCVEYEGSLMGHCVGGYGREVESGRLEIYSLRDKDNMPHVTIEVFPRYGYDEGAMQIKQIKGRENASPVAKYIPKVLDFIRKMKGEYEVHWDTEARSDLLGMSMTIEDDGGLYMWDPPFQPDTWNAQGYEREFEEGDPDDEEYYEYDEPMDKPLENEEASVVNGTFNDVLLVISDVMGYDSYYVTDSEAAKKIMNHFAMGRSFWSSLDDPEDEVYVEVHHRDDHYGPRQLKKVL